jgi:uronate dehydrogenase
MAMQRVLITGAGGGIGRSLRETLRDVYPVLRLSDRVALEPARADEEIDRTEISDMAAVERMVEGSRKGLRARARLGGPTSRSAAIG